MSLIKTDSGGRIRKSWVEKKSTKRLEVIRDKATLNYLTLNHAVNILNNFGLDYLEAYLERERFMYLDSQLQVIIMRRYSAEIKRLKDEI